MLYFVQGMSIIMYQLGLVLLFIFIGQAGGNFHTNKGGGSNYLCLPNDPDNGKSYAFDNDVLYGAEYQVESSAKLAVFANMLQQDVPCDVCRRKGKSSVFMIPGKRFTF